MILGIKCLENPYFGVNLAKNSQILLVFHPSQTGQPGGGLRPPRGKMGVLGGGQTPQGQMLGSGGGVQPPQGQMSCSGGGGFLCDLLGPPPWDQSAELLIYYNINSYQSVRKKA